MAIFHFPVTIVKRSLGQSAVAKAAYNARAEIQNEQTGQLHDYSRAQGLLFEGIFAPKDAPEWAKDRARLWNEVEKSEKRKDAQLARNIEIALPHELTDEQRQRLLTDFVRENFLRQGMIADVCLHAPDREGDERNFHAHVLLTLRRIGPDGFAKEKAREWNTKEQLQTWRENWARTANRYLERHGHETRIDHRTLEAQGIDREATEHLGPIASQLEREGKQTERGDINREIKARNAEREKLEQAAKHVSAELCRTEAERKAEQARERTQAREQALQAQRQGEREGVKTKIERLAANNANAIDYIMALQEEGFQIGKRDGRFVAVLENGAGYFIPHQELLADLQQAGVVFKSYENIRGDQKEAWRQAREQERKAAADERRPAFEHWRSDDLSQGEAAIRLLYTLAPHAEAFASAIEDKGLLLARATAQDAQASRNFSDFAARAGKHVLSLQEGGFYVLTPFGRVIPLNNRSTGAAAAEVEKRLAGLQDVLTVADARDIAKDYRAHVAQERAFMDKTNEARKITLAAVTAPLGLGMVQQQQAAMRRIKRRHQEAARKLRPQAPEMPPPEDRAREVDPAHQSAEAERRQREAEEWTRQEQAIRRQREEAGRTRKEAEAQRQHEADARRKQEQPAQRPAQEAQRQAQASKSQAKEKPGERTARTEQTEAQQRAMQAERNRELFERKFGKGHNTNDLENWQRGRERERER